MKILLLAFSLAISPKPIDISATTTGISAGDMADTLVSEVINMEEGNVCNQLSWTLAVTPGTSTRVTVGCEESATNTTNSWSDITICYLDTVNAKSVCIPQLREYTLADYSGTVKEIASRWQITKQFVRCTFDDPDDGNGTITVTGARSWQ